MSGRVLITGAGGFVGRHLCAHLATLAPRPQVIGVELVDAPIPGCDWVHRLDVSSADAVADVIRASAPEYIIHLAGMFGTQDPQEVYRVNVLSMTALLEAARRFVPDAILVVAGSAAEWGPVPAEQMPVTERTVCRPVTPYGLSKLLATESAAYYYRVHQVRVMVARLFQPIGPGAPLRSAPGTFADQLRRIVPAGRGVLRVGNLDTYRDFVDVRDAVRALWSLCEKPAPGEVFNLCSGRPTRMADLLDKLIDISGARVTIEVDRERRRGATEIPVMVGTPAKLTAHCGWRPLIALEQSLQDLWDATACDVPRGTPGT